MKQPADIRAALGHALADLQLPAGIVEACAVHWELMLRWNARTNLTAVTDPQEGAWLHYRDSLAALPLLGGGPIVDFGSGAGFPGLPLAMACPQWQFTLVEPRRKRASFLQNAVAHLRLSNVQVRLGRMEDAPDRAYAHAVTRATFSEDAVLRDGAPWLADGGTLLAYRSEREATAALSVHRYKLRSELRRIEIWRFSGPVNC